MTPTWLPRYSTVLPLTRALHEEGAQVAVVQRFHGNASLEVDGVKFEFCSDDCAPPLSKWQIPRSFHRTVHNVCRAGNGTPVILHLHGLFYPLQLASLARLLPGNYVVVAQNHAEHPWRKPFGTIQGKGLRRADGFFFAARELADTWIERRIISSKQQIFPVMEGSTEFKFQNRKDSRLATGISGDPVLLWVGRLIQLKDPLTVLEGFEHILLQLPEAKLYMAYHQPELLCEVRRRIAASGRLKDAVVLLGQVPHAQLESIYNSADYFVLGSHYEGSGFALAEAMACGVVPVVTDIPSFRTMTDHSRVGACWTRGNARAFAGAFLKAAQQPIDVLSKQTISFFQQQLSYPAIARNSIHAYREMLAAKSKGNDCESH